MNVATSAPATALRIRKARRRRAASRSLASVAAIGLRVVHRVDRGHLEVLVDQDLELAAVGLAQMRLVGRAVVDVGLRALQGGARNLRLGGGRDLRGDVARQRLLLLPVGPDVPARRAAAAIALPRAGRGGPPPPPRRPPSCPRRPPPPRPAARAPSAPPPRPP